jgi:hypothetical protein
MEIAYLHVVINHLPIMGVPVGIFVLALGVYARNDAIKRTALLVFAAIGLATVAVYLAGQGGEDFVEHLPGVSEDAIEAHEGMAGIALFATEALALLSPGVFARFGGPAMLSRSPAAVAARAVPGWAVAVVMVVALATAAVLGYTGKLGGQIRHTEFVEGGIVAAGHDERDDERGKHGGRGRR